MKLTCECQYLLSRLHGERGCLPRGQGVIRVVYGNTIDDYLQEHDNAQKMRRVGFCSTHLGLVQ